MIPDTNPRPGELAQMTLVDYGPGRYQVVRFHSWYRIIDTSTFQMTATHYGINQAITERNRLETELIPQQETLPE
jgi:hypothetical protein